MPAVASPPPPSAAGSHAVTAPALSLELLAAALATLSPADRAKLAAMLTDCGKDGV